MWFNVGDVYSSGEPLTTAPPAREPDPKQPYAERTPHHGARSAQIRAKSIMAVPHRILARAIDGVDMPQ